LLERQKNAVGEAGGVAGVWMARSARSGALAVAITANIAMIITAPDARIISRKSGGVH